MVVDISKKVVAWPQRFSQKKKRKNKGEKNKIMFPCIPSTFFFFVSMRKGRKKVEKGGISQKRSLKCTFKSFLGVLLEKRDHIGSI